MRIKQAKLLWTAGLLFLLLFLLCVVVGVLFHLSRSKDRAEVFLDVSNQNKQINGKVLFDGDPVNIGTVHVTVFDAQYKTYLFGKTTNVMDGQFAVPTEGIFSPDHPNQPLQVNAEFRGKVSEPTKPGSEQIKGPSDQSKPVFGEATLYVNLRPPLDRRLFWGALAFVAALLVLQFLLFTGRIGRAKARWLFILMYFFTFFSLSVPILLSLAVAQNPNLVITMQASPIGLVKAKAKGLADSQWLFNMGGTFNLAPAQTQPENPTPGKTPRTGPAAVQVKNSNDTQGVAPIPIPGGQGSPAAPSGPSDTPTIVGGLAVPFYVVLLAMFGAGINMTLKVPQIQLEELPDSPKTYNRVHEEPQDKSVIASQQLLGSRIRRELIENYMYLLSAPFLAIAMYYLLQLVAEQVSQPVLVVMAFATGLVSKGVISGIIGFAEQKLQPWLRSAGAAPAATKETKGDQTKTEVAAAARTGEDMEKRQGEVEEAPKKENSTAEAKQGETGAAAKPAEGEPALTADAEAAAKPAEEVKPQENEGGAA
ncbi:MAG: hypothetical protein ABSC19_10230, partial [Syntrophorhabdales bacterium]